MNTEKNYQPTNLILPNGHESWLDIRTNNKGKVQIPNLEGSKGRIGQETHVHVVTEKPFSEVIREILLTRKYILHEIDSPQIQTKAVASREFGDRDPFARQKGYNEFQHVLLQSEFFGKDNRNNSDSYSGYIEMESCSKNLYIPWQNYNDNGEILRIPDLKPQSVEGSQFKRGDLHLTVSKIDQRLEELLLDKGFYYADFTTSESSQVNKTASICQGLDRVLTIQCANIKDINIIKAEIIRFLGVAGGCKGSIFDEPTLAYCRTKNNSVPPCSYTRIR